MGQRFTNPSHAAPGQAQCPGCGCEGRRVSPATLESLLCAEARRRFQSLDGFWFCATPACHVAYFHPATGEGVGCAEVRVPIFQ
jgi:hypothetical protein